MSEFGFLLMAGLLVFGGVIAIASVVIQDRAHAAEQREREMTKAVLRTSRPELRERLVELWPEDYQELVEEVEREQRSEEQA